MKILYITRKYPPMTGGMEKMNFHLSQNLKKLTDLELISWGKSKKWLPLVLPYFLLKSSWILLKKKIDIIHLGDGLLSPLGLILKKIFNKPCTATVYGLDVTWRFWFYQFLIPRCLKKLDKIICISNQTKIECLKRGISKEKITVIHPGIDISEFYLHKDRQELRKSLSEKFKIDLLNKKILLSCGRLVERKGFHWFILEVMPKILEKREDVIYLIAGDGVFREKVEEAISKKGLDNHAIMLGKVDDKTLKLLYNSSDIFIMPNIPVKGDMEGFGIVTLEAASCGVPVVASKLEGIKDAVREGGNGFLVEPFNVNGFVDAISRLLENDYERKKAGLKAREFTLENYSWEKVAERCYEECEKVTEGK